MDWGVAVALGLGLASIWVSIWTTKQAARDERARRAEERRTDAYIEILRTANRRTAALLAQIFNAWAADEIQDAQMRRQRVQMPPEAELAEADALVAAFASAEVSRVYLLWLNSLEAIANGFDDYSFEGDQVNWKYNPNADRLHLLGQVANERLVAVELQVRIELSRQHAPRRLGGY